MAQAGLGYPTYDQPAPQTGVQAGLNEPLTMADQHALAFRMREQGASIDEIRAALGIETTPPETADLPDTDPGTLANIGFGARQFAEDTAQGVGEWLGEDGSGFFHDAGEAMGPTAAQEEAQARAAQAREDRVAAGEQSAVSAFGGKVRDSIEQSVGPMAAIVGGAAAGGQAGAAVGTMVGGPVGAAIGGSIGMAVGAVSASLPSYFNQNVEKARENGLDPEDPGVQKRIWGASVIQSGAEALVPAKIARLLGVGNLAERAIYRSVTRGGGREATQEGLTEALTEAGQEITSEIFLNPELWGQLSGEQKLELKPWLDMITSEDVAIAAVAGGAMGAGAGGVAGGYHQSVVNKARQADVSRLTALANEAGVSPDRLNEAIKDPKLAPKVSEAAREVLAAERMRNALTKYHDTTPGDTGVAELQAATRRADAALDTLMPMLGGKTTAQLRADKEAAAKARDQEVRTKARDAGFVPAPEVSTEEIDRNVSALQAARAAREDAQQRLSVAQKPSKRLKAQAALTEAMDAEAAAREAVHRHVEGKSPADARTAVSDWRRGAAEAERRAPAVAAQRARNFSPEDTPLAAAIKALDILERFDPKKAEGSKGLLDKIAAAQRQVDTAGSVEEMQAAEQKVRDLQGRLGQPAPIYSAAEEVLAELPEEVVASAREQRAQPTEEATAKPAEEGAPEQQAAKAKPEAAPVTKPAQASAEAVSEPVPAQAGAATSLPEAPERYFVPDAQTQDVPLASLKPKRARPGGVQRAGELMAKASRGEVPPRAPISVRAEPDGTFTILDGNSTFANAKASGWKSMPVRVVTDEQFHEENAPKLVKGIKKDTGVTIRTTAKDGRIRAYVSGPALQRGAVIKAINARAAKEGLNVDVAPSSERAPTRAPERVPTADVPEPTRAEFARQRQKLRLAAMAAAPDVDTLMALAAEADPSFQDVNAQIAQMWGAAYHAGPIKARERIASKLAEAGNPAAGYIADAIRGTFVPRTRDHADAIVAQLRDTYGPEAVADKGWERVPESGYTDRKLLVQTPNGIIAEVQLVAPAMYAAKQAGHSLYTKMRVLPEGSEVRVALEDASRALYDGAREREDGSFATAPGYSSSTATGSSDLNPNGSPSSPESQSALDAGRQLSEPAAPVSFQNQSGLSTSATPGSMPATNSELPSSMNLGVTGGPPSGAPIIPPAAPAGNGMAVPADDPRHDGYYIDRQNTPWVSLVNEVGSDDPAQLEVNMRAWTAENGFEASAFYAEDGSLLGVGTNRSPDEVAVPKQGPGVAGATFTHTHPQMSPFSAPDIGLMLALQMPVRAVLPDGQVIEMRPGPEKISKAQMKRMRSDFIDGPFERALRDTGTNPGDLSQLDRDRIRQEAVLRFFDAAGVLEYSSPLQGISPEHMEVIDVAVDYAAEGTADARGGRDGRTEVAAAREEGGRRGADRAEVPAQDAGAEQGDGSGNVAAALDTTVVGEEDRISTRFPKQVKSTENPLANGDLQVNEASMRANPRAFEHNMSRVRTYPGWRHGDLDADATAAAFKQDIKDNLLWLYDQIDPDISERTRLWYKGARRIVDVWAPRYGLPPRSIAGVMAALSPQKDWYQNVSLAERTLDIMTGEQTTPWDTAMAEAANLVFKPGNADHRALKQAIVGRTLGELQTPLEMAAWVRIFDTAKNPRTYREVTSDGDFAGPGPRNVAWGSFAEIAKAIRVILDPSYENISRTMGDKHKVRSFFNNIIAPDSPAGDVTIDTHAVAAALMRPLSGNTAEVMDNFGNSLARVHQQPGYLASKPAGVSGTSGLYGLYADAYRDAAAERGLLPREMQSITWEAARGLFDAVGKRIGTGKTQAADAIWKEVTDGNATPQEARERVSDLFGGLQDPSWIGRHPELHGPEERSSYAETLPRSGIPGWGSEPIAGGAGGGAAGAVPVDAGGEGASGTTGLWTDAFEGVPFNAYRGLLAAGTDGVYVPETGQPGFGAPTTGERAGQGSGPDFERTSSSDARPLPARPPLAGLPASSPGPNRRIAEAADQYLKDRGMPVRRQAAYVKADPARGKRIADAFDAMPDDIDAPGVREAYEQLAREVIDQYRAAIDAGLQVSVITPDMPDPYPAGPKQVLEDLRRGHMWVYPTEMGFGTINEADRSSPMLQPTEFMVGNHRMLVNDLFRVVHDFFGHGREGVGFGAAGEENTWQSHVRMFSPLAARAMTTETRGQNSWVNYGPYGEHNRTNPRDTIFADQKLGLLPEWVSTEALVDAPPPNGGGVAYASRPVSEGGEAIRDWAREQGFTGLLDPAQMHVTTAYSTRPVELEGRAGTLTIPVDAKPMRFGNGLVIPVDSPELQADWQRHMDAGASWDYPDYRPHVTFKYNPTEADIARLAKAPPFRGEVTLGDDTVEALNPGAAAGTDLGIGLETRPESWLGAEGVRELEPAALRQFMADIAGEFGVTPAQAHFDRGGWFNPDTQQIETEPSASVTLAGNPDPDQVRRFAAAVGFGAGQYSVLTIDDAPAPGADNATRLDVSGSTLSPERIFELARQAAPELFTGVAPKPGGAQFIVEAVQPGGLEDAARRLGDLIHDADPEADVQLSAQPVYVEFVTGGGTGEGYAEYLRDGEGGPEGGIADRARRAAEGAFRPVGIAAAADPAQPSMLSMMNAEPVDTTSPRFKKWFEHSLVRNPDGSPKRVYHGTPKQFRSFQTKNITATVYTLFGPVNVSRQGAFFSDDPSFAEEFVGTVKAGNPSMVAAYLSMQNPLDLRHGIGDDVWQEFEEAEFNPRAVMTGDAAWENFDGPEGEEFIATVKRMGYDGVLIYEYRERDEPYNVWVALEPTQIKSVWNRGSWSPTNPDIAAGTDLAWPTYMKAPTTPGREALRNLRDTAADPAKALSSWALKLETEIVNQFAPIRALEMAQHGELGVGMDSAFKSAEIAVNDSGRAETLMYYGAGALDTNGAFRPAPGTIGIRAMLDKLGSGQAIVDWQKFMAARRARHLKARGFKVPLNDDQIADGLAKRSPLFEEVAADWKRFNDANIDLLEQTGTIKPAAAKALKADPTYIPFYRADERIDGEPDLFDEFGIGAPARAGNAAGSRVLTNRDPGIKRMRGGEVLKLDNLVENMIKNSHAQVAAAMRNAAANKAIDLLTEAGLATVAKGSKKPHKSAMAALIGGRKRWVIPTDAAAEPVFIALAGMKPQQLTGLHKAMATIASFFRHGITASPAFMVRNLIRGMVSTGVLTSGANLGLANNVFTGAAASLRRAAPRQVFTAMSGMGDFRFGGHDTGLGDSDWMVEYGLARPTFGSRWRKAMNAIEHVGTATELGDRLAAMQTMIGNGVRPDEAAYHALTIVNYSRHGSNAFLRNMLPLIPFLNARIQGLARLGGGAVTGKGALGRRQAMMQLVLNGTLLAMASAALWGWNNEDDERRERYQAEPLHRRLNYHIVYAGDTKILIPKAFEIGAVFSSLPEMVLQAAVNDDTSELGEATRQTLVNTFSFNPIPAAALPAIEAAANYSFFTGQPVESQRFEGMLPRDRVDRNTSAVAKVLAQTWLGDWLGVSPIMAQHMLEGYGGAPFAALAAATDLISADLGLQPARPAGAFGSVPVASRAAEGVLGSMVKLVGGDPANRYIGGFYDMKTAITQVYRSAKDAAQSGDMARARAILDRAPGGAAGVAQAYKMVNRAGGKLTELNRAIRSIESDRALSPTEKREKLTPLVNARNQLTEQVYRTIRSFEQRAGGRFSAAA